MNQRQKKFILEKLIPFILREQGEGFVMETWKNNFAAGEEVYFDNVEHIVPVCGTVACIGGSIQCLTGARGRKNLERQADLLGITSEQARGLFYSWQPETVGSGHSWPLKFAQRFENAATPYRKARVAVSLLKEIVKKGGQILEPQKESV